MRELREFREHHEAFRTARVAVAGVNADSVAGNRRWTERLRIPYPLLSDPGREAGRALGVIFKLGIGEWSVELFRRSTFLVDVSGIVVGVWGKVKIRGHARDVLETAKRLSAPGEA